MTYKFPVTSCSQCGREFGPGDHGYSHCDQHRDDDAAKKEAEEIIDQVRDFTIGLHALDAHDWSFDMERDAAIDLIARKLCELNRLRSENFRLREYGQCA